MTFKFNRSDLGKKFASANYDFVLPVTLNETNIERMLIQVLERVVKQGKTSPPHSNAKNSSVDLRFETLLETLSSNRHMKGFDSQIGKSVLSGWLRTNVVEMIPLGKSRNDIQIDYLRPLTVAVYRSGFPRWRSRHRKTDQLVYRSMLSSWMANDNATPSALMAHLINSNCSVFTGVDFTDAMHPHSNPEYNGRDLVDINSLLVLRYLEGIPGRDPVADKNVIIDGLLVNPDRLPLASPVPTATTAVGDDLINFLTSYGQRSAGEVIASMQCILAFRLFQMPIVTANVLAKLVDDPSFEVEKGSTSEENQLEMFFDFTNGAVEGAKELARHCVERDLKSLANLFRNLVIIREVERSSRALKHLSAELDSLKPTARLARIANLKDDAQVDVAAGVYLEQISSELDAPGEEQNKLEFERIRESSVSQVEALVELVVEDREREALNGYRKWAYSTGGLTSSGERREYALLSGTMKAPSTWRYAMTEPLLLTLIDLCFLDEKGRPSASGSMQLSTLMLRLEKRFGVLIGKPPKDFDSPESRLAATQNLRSFVQLLKNLGYFQGLSDDFSAQHITRPTNVRVK